MSHASFADPSSATPPFELRFASLFDAGRALAFPCDAEGRVDLGRLSERARDNYFVARSRVGRDFATPIVRPRPGERRH